MMSHALNPRITPWTGLPKRAWVTGAGKGIGRALSLRLAALGWTVYASARTRDDLDTLVSETAGGPGEIVPLVLDITDRAACAAAVETVTADGRPLGLAVLNAGTHVPTPLAEFDAATVAGLVDTNLNGTVNCLAPLMRKMSVQECGHIAVVASLAGYRGLPKAAAYSATKAALIAMCEGLYPELRRAGVSLSVVNPGFVRTPLTDRNDFDMPFLVSVDDAVDAIVKGLARGRFEIRFPTRFAVLMGLLRALPYRLYFRLTSRLLD